MAKRVFCTMLLAVLGAFAVFIMFSGMLGTDLNEMMPMFDFVDKNEVMIQKFPFYGGNADEGNFGVFDIVKTYSQNIKDKNAPFPNFMGEIGKLYARADFMDALYAFLLIAVMTIPVYMVLCFVVFNGAYELGKKWFFPFKYLWFGIVTVVSSFVTVASTWVMYKTVIYDIVLKFLMNLAEEITKNVQIALATSNILTLAVVGVLVCLLLHRTLFRGSVFLSLLGAVLRTMLFLVLVAFVNVIVYELNVRSMLFVLVFLFAMGLFKVILFPDKHTN
ncbi:MAG: hypothetical protein IKJ65_08200 [Clostridia bacterium]|nr:hypothetical protein [Clostridia bacterium]